MEPLCPQTPKNADRSTKIPATPERKGPVGSRSRHDQLLAEVIRELQSVFQTDHDVFITSSSPEGVLEGAVTNFFSPDDRIVCTVMGENGRQWSEMASVFGLDVVRLGCERGWVVTARDLDLFLESGAGEQTRGVLVTHHEPSTGVYTDLASISQVCQRHGVLFLVDAVHSLGALPLFTDRWMIDVVVSATPGFLTAPAGCGMYSVSSRAWEAHWRAGCPRYSQDLGWLKKGTSLPCDTLLRGLGEVLDMFLKEGDQVFSHSRSMAKMLRRGVTAMGFELLVPDENIASPVVTAITLPEKVATQDIASFMEQGGISVEIGMSQAADRLIRVGHWGPVGPGHIVATLTCLGWACRSQGVAVNLEAALAAAWEVYRDE